MEVSFVASSVATSTEEVVKPTVEQLISQIAEEYAISSTTLHNLVKSESQFNPNAVGDKGCSYGLTQENICVHTSVTKEEALDPMWSLERAAKRIKNGEESAYTSCNCYSLVSIKTPIPRMAAIQPNTEAHTGAVAIFYYPTKAGEWVKHVAYVLEVDEGFIKVVEANKKPCLVGTRTVPTSDPHLVGFWSS